MEARLTGPPGLNSPLFLGALRARRKIFIAVLTVTVVAATVVSLLLPKSYRATASLVVDRRNEQSLDDALNVLRSQNERLGYLQTQVDVIMSDKVARRVVADLKLADDPKARAKFAGLGSNAGSIEEWLAQDLLHQLDVTTSQSSVIDLNVVSDTAARAADIANGFAKAYSDTVLELDTEPSQRAASWFDDQLKTLRSDLEKRQGKLRDYQRSHGIVTTEGDLNNEQARLDELSQELVRTEEQTMLLRGRERQAREAAQDGTLLEHVPDIESNEQIRRLKEDLLAGEAHLEVLATQYGVNYPEYQRQVAENNARKRTIATEMTRIVAAGTAARRQSELHESEIKYAIEEQRARLLKLGEGRDDLAVLAGDVKAAQTAYESAMQRFVVNQVDGRASQANVSLLSSAIAPTRPYRPNTRLNVLLSFFVGTLLAGGVVVALELGDRRVRTITDIDLGPDVPVLGALDPWLPAEPLRLAGPTGESGLPARTS